jgi:hypothetical protein
MKKKIFKVYHEEVNTNLVVRGPIEVSEDTHPELKGKTDDEIIQYIKDNAWEMKTSNEYYDSLGEDLADSDIVKDKIIPESDSIIVELAGEEEDEDEGEDED